MIKREITVSFMKKKTIETETDKQIMKNKNITKEKRKE